MMVYQPGDGRLSRRVAPSRDGADDDCQLFRYAHDLNDLMLAHTALTRQYQGLLASLGHTKAPPPVEPTRDVGWKNWSTMHDTQTGLPNQYLLDEQLGLTLQSAQTRGQSFALLYVGLDRLDLFDPTDRDFVLGEVTGRLQQAVRDNDLVARVTPGVFAVLLMGTHSQPDVRCVAENLLTAMATPVYIGKKRMRLTCNMGCARYPLDGTDAHMLRKNAVEALCHAKREGGSHLHFHGAEPDGDRPFSLGLPIWGAIERGEMHLVYQPRFSLGPNPIVRGCEALLRWYHPMKGVIAPNVFIPVAERNGAILELGDWVLAQAINQIACWQASGIAGLCVSVNVSPLQLDTPDFVDRLTDLAALAGVDARCIELEITESLAKDSAVLRLAALARLREGGFRVALVDCGKGLSFLSGAQPLPIDCLKIDRQLIHQLNRNDVAKAMTRCVVEMGIALGVDVVADGVESDAQLTALTNLGCHFVQGYLTGRPMSPQLFSGYLSGCLGAVGAFGAMNAG